MDDEGFGIRRVKTVLDRRGFAFKLDIGTSSFRRGDLSTSATAGNIELGGFITPAFGIFVGTTLSGVTDGLGDILTRHAFFLELQSLPLALGRLHIGGYGNGGFALLASTGASGTAESGPAFGGGALMELDLTGRLALTLRAGANAAQFPTGWSPAAMVMGGLAIY
jgi:hypothetical protein